MLVTIRDRVGQGNSALYVRFRDATTRFWDFIATSWVLVESTTCKAYLHEYPDSDPLESRYQYIITPPPVDPDIAPVVEYVGVDGSVIGEERVPVSTALASDLTALSNKLGTPIGTTISADIARALGLLYANTVLDQIVTVPNGNITSARMRCYDTPTNANAAGVTGLLNTFAVVATLDGTGNPTMFKITG